MSSRNPRTPQCLAALPGRRRPQRFAEAEHRRSRCHHCRSSAGGARRQPEVSVPTVPPPACPRSSGRRPSQAARRGRDAPPAPAPPRHAQPTISGRANRALPTRCGPPDAANPRSAAPRRSAAASSSAATALRVFQHRPLQREGAGLVENHRPHPPQPRPQRGAPHKHPVALDRARQPVRPPAESPPPARTDRTPRTPRSSPASPPTIGRRTTTPPIAVTPSANTTNR